MPLDRAIALISRNFEEHTLAMKERAARAALPPAVSPVPVKVPGPSTVLPPSDFKVPDQRLRYFFHLLADCRYLTVDELNQVIDYLVVRRDKLMEDQGLAPIKGIYSPQFVHQTSTSDVNQWTSGLSFLLLTLMRNWCSFCYHLYPLQLLLLSRGRLQRWLCLSRNCQGAFTTSLMEVMPQLHLLPASLPFPLLRVYLHWSLLPPPSILITQMWKRLWMIWCQMGQVFWRISPLWPHLKMMMAFPASLRLGRATAKAFWMMQGGAMRIGLGPMTADIEHSSHVCAFWLTVSMIKYVGSIKSWRETEVHFFLIILYVYPCI